MAKNDIDRRRKSAMESAGCKYSRTHQGWMYGEMLLGHNHTVAFKRMVEIGLISQNDVPQIVKSPLGPNDRMRAK